MKHRKIADGVYVTSYENGFSVSVNYNDEPYGNIPAHGFIIGQ
jgi:hypothetical protein